ncbi:cytokinin dehydrogenase 7-like [Typha latifolia]|uniref:cytokinin dehydrogenase 7-like n=1 Tax=Typha latifolia TaxID=4733 RepID=UPI003C2D8802
MMSSVRTSSIPPFLIVVFLVSSLMSIIGHDKQWPTSLPQQLQALDLATRIRLDQHAIGQVSTDFGRLKHVLPAAVLQPSSVDDMVTLVQFSYMSEQSFKIAPRGQGHSVRGQALVPGGVVIETSSLRHGGVDGKARITVYPSKSAPMFAYVDVGGEQLWIDVLWETLKHGLTPRSWTDYLYLTVGGTLSNAGISGQAFLHGPQISNVHELDIITGKGNMITCSADNEPDLFFAVLGGLGQFGIITRARIALEHAPQMVRWVRLIYTDFTKFVADQERSISLDQKRGFNYLEGFVLTGYNLTSNWRSSFFSGKVIGRISSLAARHSAVYCLEGAKYYDHGMESKVDEELGSLLEELNFVPGFDFQNDITYMHFLNRVRDGELKLRSMGLWDIPHPWLTIFVPRSRIVDFDQGVFKHILKSNKSKGPILIYPMNRTKWDERTSAVIPDEEIFYSVGLLRSGVHELEQLEAQNKEILQFCKASRIGCKQYLPHYETQVDWMKHFGPQWDLFVERKMRYDPKLLLAPGQRIFGSEFSRQFLANVSKLTPSKADKPGESSSCNIRNFNEESKRNRAN